MKTFLDDLQSAKFWTMLAAFIVGLLPLFGVQETYITQVSTAIIAGGTVIMYFVHEILTHKGFMQMFQGVSINVPAITPAACDNVPIIDPPIVATGAAGVTAAAQTAQVTAGKPIQLFTFDSASGVYIPVTDTTQDAPTLNIT